MRQILAVGLVCLMAGCQSPTDDSAVDTRWAETFLLSKLEPSPTLDRTLSANEWADAYSFQGAFNLSDGNKADGSYGFNAGIGYNDRWLFLYVELPTAGPNPYSSYAAPVQVYSDVLELRLDSADSSSLHRGADFKSFTNQRNYGSNTYDGYWNGQAWVMQQSTGAQWGEDGPQKGTWGRGGFTNESLYWEIVIDRQPENRDVDLTLESGTAYRFCLTFARAIDDGTKRSDASWPPNATPTTNLQAWASFVIPEA